MPPPNLRIALLEDDPDQGAVIATWLRERGHEVTHFLAGKDVVAHLRRHAVDAVLLDKRVPDLTGMDVLKWIRNDLAIPVPVIMITSFDEEADVVEALASGADDYIVKPLRRAELLARIDAAWRRSTGRNASVGSLTLGPYRLERDQAKIWLHGDPVEVTQKEFDIAWHLFRHAGSLVARNDLMHAVWGLNENIQTRTLDVHMSRVRRKLALQPENGVRLQSIYSFGYRFDIAHG